LQKLIGPTQLLLWLPALCHGQPVLYLPLAVWPGMPGPSPDAPGETAMPALAGCAPGGGAPVDCADALVKPPVSASAATDVVSNRNFLITPSSAKHDSTSLANAPARTPPVASNLAKKKEPEVYFRDAISNPHERALASCASTDGNAY
jgi:hypothetical protein